MLNRIKNFLASFMMTTEDVQDLHRKLDLIERKIAAQRNLPGASKTPSVRSRVKRPLQS